MMNLLNVLYNKEMKDEVNWGIILERCFSMVMSGIGEWIGFIIWSEDSWS